MTNIREETFPNDLIKKRFAKYLEGKDFATNLESKSSLVQSLTAAFKTVAASNAIKCQRFLLWESQESAWKAWGYDKNMDKKLD